MLFSPEQTWALQQIIYNDVLEEIHSHFVSIGIRYMPVKGAALILSGHAEKIAMRQMCDIDIIVDDNFLRFVSDYFNQLKSVSEYIDYTDSDIKTETSFLWRYKDGYIGIEIHSHINMEYRFSLSTNDMFRSSYLLKDNCFLPIPEMSLLICIVHSLCHISFQLKPSIFIEMAVINDSLEFSHSRFWELASDTGVLSYIVFMICMYNQQNFSFITTPQGYRFARLASYILHFIPINRVPRWVRRIVFELFFVKEPIKLLVHHFIVVSRIRHAISQGFKK